MLRLRRGILGLCVLLAAGGLSAAPALAVNPCEVTSASTLATAIDDANSGTCPTITFDVIGPDATLTLTTALPELTAANVTIDGSNGGVPLVITTNGTSGIFSVSSGNATLENLTVDGDNTTPYPQAVDGGAIHIDETSTSETVTIKNSTFEADSEASGHSGGAIADLGTGAVAISNSTFEDDSSLSGNGGALYFDTDSPSGASPTVSSSLFEDDSAIDGGAIYNAASSGEEGVQVSGSTFENDTATTDGGALDNAGGTFTDASVYGSVLIGNTAGVNGGAIDNGDGGARAALFAGTSEFSGNDAQTGGGAAIYEGADSPGSDSFVWQSTFAGDKLGSETGANGYAIDATGGQSLDVAANLFVEDCAGTFTSTGYNVAMPASSGLSPGGAACAGGAIGDEVTTEAGDVADSSQNPQLLTPVSPNPALDLVPDSAAVELGGSPATVCPVTDLLGNQGPDVSGRCNAGALQNPPGFQPGSGGTASGSGPGSGGSGSGSGSGSGGTGSGGEGTTPAPISTTALPKKTLTTIVKFDNQLITLVSPAVCTAAGKSISTTLSSKKIKGSKKPKLSFKLATLTVGGKDKHTAKRLTAKVSIKLKGLKAHTTDKLKVVVSYHQARTHRTPKTVAKAITVKFKIC